MVEYLDIIVDRLEKIEFEGGRLKVDANLEVSDLEIGAVEIKDHNSDDRAFVGNLEEDGQLGLGAMIMCAEPSAPDSNPAKPLPFLGEDQICYPYYAPYVPRRGLEVGIGAMHSEFIHGMPNFAQIDDGNYAQIDSIPNHKFRRIQGRLGHDAEVPGATLTIRWKDIFFYNGMTQYVRKERTIKLDLSNQDMMIDIPAMASWCEFIITNGTGGIITYYLFLEGVN